MIICQYDSHQDLYTLRNKKYGVDYLCDKKGNRPKGTYIAPWSNNQDWKIIKLDRVPIPVLAKANEHFELVVTRLKALKINNKSQPLATYPQEFLSSIGITKRSVPVGQYTYSKETVNVDDLGWVELFIFWGLGPSEKLLFQDLNFSKWDVFNCVTSTPDSIPYKFYGCYSNPEVICELLNAKTQELLSQVMVN